MITLFYIVIKFGFCSLLSGKTFKHLLPITIAAVWSLVITNNLHIPIILKILQIFCTSFFLF